MGSISRNSNGNDYEEISKYCEMYAEIGEKGPGYDTIAARNASVFDELENASYIPMAPIVENESSPIRAARNALACDELENPSYIPMAPIVEDKSPGYATITAKNVLASDELENASYIPMAPRVEDKSPERYATVAAKNASACDELENVIYTSMAPEIGDRAQDFNEFDDSNYISMAPEFADKSPGYATVAAKKASTKFEDTTYIPMAPVGEAIVGETALGDSNAMAVGDHEALMAETVVFEDEYASIKPVQLWTMHVRS